MKSAKLKIVTPLWLWNYHTWRFQRSSLWYFHFRALFQANTAFVGDSATRGLVNISHWLWACEWSIRFPIIPQISSRKLKTVWWVIGQPDHLYGRWALAWNCMTGSQCFIPTSTRGVHPLVRIHILALCIKRTTPLGFKIDPLGEGYL